MENEKFYLRSTLKNPEKNFFENYETTEEDFEEIIKAFDNAFNLRLFEIETLDDLRVVIFDSKNIYILTTGIHTSSGNYRVEEIPIKRKTRQNLKLYKIPIRISESREEDYKGASAWFEHDSISETAVNPKMVDNPKTADQENKNKILKAIVIPPPTPFNKIHRGYFNYQTDVLIHEIGHIEEMMLYYWPNDTEVPFLPTEDQRAKFLSFIQASDLFKNIPGDVKQTLINNIDRATIGEMYAMMIDREAKRQLFPLKKEEQDRKILDALFTIKEDEELKMRILKTLKESPHQRALILIKILEELLPDYQERKNWFRKLLAQESI